MKETCNHSILIEGEGRLSLHLGTMMVGGGSECWTFLYKIWVLGRRAKRQEKEGQKDTHDKQVLFDTLAWPGYAYRIHLPDHQ